MKDLLKKVFNSEIKSIDENEMELTALISTNAIDRYREVVDPSGMDAKHYRKNPVVLWAHNYDIPPIGKALWVKREGDGIVSKVKFANTPMGKDIFQLYKDGFMKAFSIGFVPTEEIAGNPDNPKDPRRTYKKWELLEYSAVPVPANPEAVALCVKKGFIKDEDAPAILQRGFDNVDAWNDDVEQEEVVEQHDKNEDFISEINVLQSEKENLISVIKEKDGEIKTLNLVIYNQQTQIIKLKQTPGITADELGKRIVEVAGGVIRKHLGSTR